MKARGYPKITTNSIRKAVETAAASHSFEAQKMVANRLNHSLQTADKNYRAQTTGTITREFGALQNVVNNQRALNYITRKPDIAFAGMVDFPSIQELSKTLAIHMNVEDLEVNEDTYRRAQRKFDETRLLFPAL